MQLHAKSAAGCVAARNGWRVERRPPVRRSNPSNSIRPNFRDFKTVCAAAGSGSLPAHVTTNGPCSKRYARCPARRLLDSPQLARIVPHLAPELLHHVIGQRGLDVCGDLVAAATPEQLTMVFDLDLWRSSEPGRDEQFDADRFGDWLDLLVDTGDVVFRPSASRTSFGSMICPLLVNVAVTIPPNTASQVRILRQRFPG
jgi:hypothetical protein